MAGGAYDLESDSAIQFGGGNPAPQLALGDFLGDCLVTSFSGGLGYGGSVMAIFFHMPVGHGSRGVLTSPFTASQTARAVAFVANTSFGLSAGATIGNLTADVSVAS